MDNQHQPTDRGPGAAEAVTAVLGPPRRSRDPVWPNVSFIGAFNLMESPGFDVMSAPEETMLPAVAELLADGRLTVVVAGMVTWDGSAWLLDALASDPSTAAAGRVLVCIDPAVNVTWTRVERSSVDVTLSWGPLAYTAEDRAALRRAALLRSGPQGTDLA